ncbi:MAG TPA: hypothetical protein VL728_19530 [Cyclobacteriaceae bacterium]|jgi:hypothetical protein|nr:hypothetical protein [Cyclobacteriaceae bacterium]
MKKLILIFLLVPMLAFGQLQLPFPIVNLNGIVDGRFLNNGSPYTSKSQALSLIPAAERKDRRAININGNVYEFIGNGTSVLQKRDSGNTVVLTNGNGTTANPSSIDLGGNLTRKTWINQNGHNLAINGQAGGIFTKWDWTQGDLIITDDTTSIDYKLHQNVTNIVFGNSDTLRGSVGYNVLLGYANKINAPGSGFYGAYFNLVSGTQNSIQNGQANLVGGIFNYGISDNPTTFNGNFMAGDHSRMYKCFGCFSMGTMSGSNYKPLTIGTPGGSGIAGSFLYSHNSNAQTYGNGINSNYAFLLGGSDHNIPSNTTGAGALGGRKIWLTAGDSNTIYLPKVRMFRGLNAAPAVNNTADSLAVFDHGYVKMRLASSISGSGVPTTRNINTTSPLSGGGNLSADRTLSIANAAADGSTKGAASFTANDFDASSGNISIDYANANIIQKNGNTTITTPIISAANHSTGMQIEATDVSGTLSELANSSQTFVAPTNVSAIEIISADGTAGSTAPVLSFHNLGGRFGVGDYTAQTDTYNFYLEMKADASDIGTATFVDNRSTKKGIEYNATNYVTQLHSLTDKEYVDAHQNGKTYSNSVSSTNNVAVYNGTNFTYTPFASGRYTPTLSSASGFSSPTVQSFTWSRNGTIVTVSGAVTIGTKGSNGTMSFILTLPVTSSLTSTYDANGVANWQPVAQSGQVFAVGSTSTVEIIVIGALAGSGDVSMTFQYEVK